MQGVCHKRRSAFLFVKTDSYVNKIDDEGGSRQFFGGLWHQWLKPCRESDALRFMQTNRPGQPPALLPAEHCHRRFRPDHCGRARRPAHRPDAGVRSDVLLCPAR